MAEPFLSEIKMLPYTVSGGAPKGFATCDGQLLPINQNQALFSLLGTTFGGNGQSNFALPDMRGRIPLHFGGNFVLGQRGGEETHTITMNEMAAHSHAPLASSLPANATSLSGNFWGAVGVNPYHPTANTPMNAAAVGSFGAASPQAHQNISPYLTINFVIALVGIFPSRN
jgi:microcystin-dependent protein